MRVVLADAAKSDLKAIMRYTKGQWGGAQAQKYLSSIRERFRLLGNRPELGTVRTEFQRPLRSFPVEKHIIYYRVTTGTLHVVRILHQRMDAVTHL